MKRFFIVAAIVSAFATAVFAQAEQIGVRQWKLVQLNGVSVGESSAAYLQLDEGQTRLTGNAGCNRMFGTAKVERSRVDFSSIATTRMACRDRSTRRLESDFIRTLERVDRFERRGNLLDFYIRRRLVMRFEAPTRHPPVEPEPATGLQDKKWVLESIGNRPVSRLGRTAFVVFDTAKRSAGGNSSCNVFGGSYTAAANTLRITDVVATMRACIEDDRMRIEREFLDGLRNTNRYEIEHGKLMLYQNKRLLLTFNGEPK
jgi:heat shock protein HslJ